ncbi:ABC transporter substrate-binding protein [Kineococcus glutinatus]|uniref:Iron-siderophore ABC transporter substrate-binding protein n=1 Tax=Kineococcus glutinatus TaxID=1070872 RepID=A0ABP9HPD3_9ACTN
MALARPLAAAGTAALLAVLTACGGDAAAPAATAEPATPATRTVQSTFTGEPVEIPAEPQRVLALWRTGTELADLGVVPVGALDGEFAEGELAADVYAQVDDVPVVGTFEGVDIEKVIEADPDLIVGMDNGKLTIDYAELSEVAPTVILKVAEPTDVWRNYPTVADLVGRSTDFAERDAAVTADLEAIAAEHGDVLGGLEATAIGSSQDSIWVSTSKSLSYQRIDAAGFGYNPTYATDPERYVTELAAENLPDLADQDVIFYDVQLDGSVTPEVQAVLDSESFKRLPAVQAGHAFPLTSGTIYTFEGAQQQVEDLRAAAEALAGA